MNIFTILTMTRRLSRKGSATPMAILTIPKLSRACLAMLAAFCLMCCLTCCTSSPAQNKENTVGGASIAAVVQVPMSHFATRLSVEPNAAPHPGQFMLADIVTYGGKTVAVNPPPGWTLLRDDSSISVRQSLFTHPVAPHDSGVGVWTFNRPVDAQAVLLILDNVALEAPIDATSGDAGTIGLVSKPVLTSSDGDLLLVYFATDFGGTGLAAQLPLDMIVVARQEAKPFQYWVLGTYQLSKGETPAIDCPTGQLYNSVATQVAIRRAATPSGANSSQ
jgi:hypothetical protein